jgi:hypothetical protein
MPFLMMEWVWPPQTSMIFQGRVVTWHAISRAMRWSDFAVAELGEVLHYLLYLLIPLGGEGQM